MQRIVRSDHHDRTDEGEGEGEGEGDASTGAESGRRATVSDMEDAKAQARLNPRPDVIAYMHLPFRRCHRGHNGTNTY